MFVCGILLLVQVNLVFPRLIFPFGIICAWEIEVHTLVLRISWWSTTDKPNLSPIFFYSSNIDHDAIKIIKRRKHIFGFQGAKINKLDDLQHAIIFILSCEDVSKIYVSNYCIQIKDIALNCKPIHVCFRLTHIR